MKTNSIEIITLESEEGMTLTNGEVYSKKVFLGVNDSPNNWQEIPDSEVPETEINIGGAI